MRYFALVLAGVSLAACEPDNSGQAREQRQTQLNLNQASTVVGMPAIINFTEKRMLKTIYELRDSPHLVTYSYVLDLNGKRHKVCPTTSIGYGFPYATQYTAPKAPKIAYPLWPDGTQGTASARSYDADQPEPNGLYMPASADGTWVICLDPADKSLKPVYVEPRVMVYPFEMPSTD
jgi:hypothetical protein